MRRIFPLMALVALGACNGMATIGPAQKLADVDPRVHQGYGAFGFDLFQALATSSANGRRPFPRGAPRPGPSGGRTGRGSRSR
jgi:hypothetical protein